MVPYLRDQSWAMMGRGMDRCVDVEKFGAARVAVGAKVAFKLLHDHLRSGLGSGCGSGYGSSCRSGCGSGQVRARSSVVGILIFRDGISISNTYQTYSLG